MTDAEGASVPGGSMATNNGLLSRWENDPNDERTPIGITPNTRSKANSAPREPENKGAKDPAQSSTMNDVTDLSDQGRKTKSKGKGPKKSAPKEPQITDKGADSHANLAEVFQESFSTLADTMKAGFSNLGQMLQSRKSQDSSDDDDDSSTSSSESDDSANLDHEDASKGKEPLAKKRRTDDATDSILQKLEKNYQCSDQEGPEIHSSLAKIITNMITEKSDDDKVNELRKRYPKPKNCELLTETTVNLAIWNNLSEKARTSDIKLQRSQKSLVKGTTAVVGVVNELLNESEWPSKQKVVDTLMDGVQLLTNANRELNIRRRESLRPELHSSYRHLCSASNPITNELFGDDLTKAVKDITDTNKITSKVNRENNNKYKNDRKRSYGNYDNRQNKRFYSKDYSWTKNHQRPFHRKEGAKKNGQKNRN